MQSWNSNPRLLGSNLRLTPAPFQGGSEGRREGGRTKQREKQRREGRKKEGKNDFLKRGRKEGEKDPRGCIGDDYVSRDGQGSQPRFLSDEGRGQEVEGGDRQDEIVEIGEE